MQLYLGNLQNKHVLLDPLWNLNLLLCLRLEKEVEWLCNFLEDIPNWPKPVLAICTHCDNQVTIGRAQTNMYNGKSRHIRRRHNIVRQLLSSGIITNWYVSIGNSNVLNRGKIK